MPRQIRPGSVARRRAILSQDLSGTVRIYLQTAPSAGATIRFCHLILQPDLLEGWTLIRELGNQGSSGRVRRDHYPSLEAAQEAISRERDTLQGRGFRVVFAEGAGAR